MRLDNLVSKALSISRKQAKTLIAKSQIKVNQKVEKAKNRQIDKDDQVVFHDKQLSYPSERYFMLNKPQGYLCSTVDELLPSALKLLDNQRINGLHFAGRLDSDTTGLVLISDDGQWTHRVSAPNGKQGKTYLVELAEGVSSEQLEKLEHGVVLNDSEKKTLPCKVQLITSNQVRLTLFEGRYHQVKRMFASVGNHVVALHRESIGELVLETDLALGRWRELTEKEIDFF